MDREFEECIFGGINGPGEQRRKPACQQSADHATQQSFGTDEYGMRRNGEQRPEPQNISARGARGRACKRHRHQAAGLPLKEQQLDSQQHGGDG